MVASAAEVAFQQHQPSSLLDLPLDCPALVLRLDRNADPAVARRLLEIGFFSGEALRVVSRVAGGDPLAVRIGSSTFALRRHEAGCIYVQPVS